MHEILAQNRVQLTALCRRYGVERLDVFGSVLREDFDPARSDLDVVAQFLPVALGQNLDRYLDFKSGLELLFGRKVDVVEMKSVRNTRLRRYIESSRVPVYAAA